MPSKTWLLSALALGLTVACGDERVSVGELPRIVDLARCFGEGTICGQHSPLFFPPWRRIDEPQGDPQVCSPTEGDPWHIAWRQTLSELPCEPFGKCTARAVTVAGDGSVWIAALGDRLAATWQAGIFLMHLDRDGEIIAKRVVETQELKGEIWSEVTLPGAQHALAIAADARGHLFVAVAWNELPDAENPAKTTAFLAEYDVSARRVGDRVELLGLSSNMQLGLIMRSSLVLVAAEAGASAGGGQGRSRAATFDSAFQRIWVQSWASPGALPNATLAYGDRLTLSRRVDLSGRMISDSIVLDTYDSQGNALAALNSNRPILPFSMDAEGNVWLLDSPSDFALNVRRVGPEGAPLSRSIVTAAEDLVLGNDPPVTAVDSAGKCYFLREDNTRPGDSLISRLVELDIEARTCVSSSVFDDDPSNPSGETSTLKALHVTDAGDVYFQSLNLIARLTR